MKTIGITGGVGMGKSTAERILRSRGFLVIDTDRIARDIVEPGTPALAEVASVFSSDVITELGTLNRAKLAEIVFGNEAARTTLEGILHPRIRQAWRAEIDIIDRQSNRFAFVVIPLLFETGAETDFDATICVACSLSTQKKRLAERGWSDTQMRQRASAQLPIHEKMDRSRFVVWNESDLDVLESQITRVLRSLS